LVSEPEEVTASMVHDRIQETVNESEALSEEEKLAKLDRLSERLSDVSSEASVDAVTGFLQSLLGTETRATAPAAEEISGPFDFDTAQLHDVLREQRDDGGYQYFAVLLDADGRTTRVELNRGEGEQLYSTMQRIKANPLLERVYRKAVMPLLDQMLSAARQAEETETGTPATNPPSDTLEKSDNRARAKPE
jgi:hypothetical protein